MLVFLRLEATKKQISRINLITRLTKLLYKPGLDDKRGDGWMDEIDRREKYQDEEVFQGKMGRVLKQMKQMKGR